VIASPDGRTRLVDTGDQRLATAGTGDVLAGMIGAFLARGLPAARAAAAAAWVHGRAVRSLPPVGVTASDVLGAVGAVIADLEGER
jgi:NAD(P)H-hydrate epimerase